MFSNRNIGMLTLIILCYSCPLFTNDRHTHHADVVRGAAAAKTELGVDKNPKLLKIDPSKGF